MNDSHNELTRERRRNEELTRLLRESRDKTIEVHVVVYMFNSFADALVANFACCLVAFDLYRYVVS